MFKIAFIASAFALSAISGYASHSIVHLPYSYAIETTGDETDVLQEKCRHNGGLAQALILHVPGRVVGYECEDSEGGKYDFTVSC